MVRNHAFEKTVGKRVFSMCVFWAVMVIAGWGGCDTSAASTSASSSSDTNCTRDPVRFNFDFDDTTNFALDDTLKTQFLARQSEGDAKVYRALFDANLCTLISRNVFESEIVHEFDAMLAEVADDETIVFAKKFALDGRVAFKAEFLSQMFSLPEKELLALRVGKSEDYVVEVIRAQSSARLHRDLSRVLPVNYELSRHNIRTFHGQSANDQFVGPAQLEEMKRIRLVYVNDATVGSNELRQVLGIISELPRSVLSKTTLDIVIGVQTRHAQRELPSYMDRLTNAGATVRMHASIFLKPFPATLAAPFAEGNALRAEAQRLFSVTPWVSFDETPCFGFAHGWPSLIVRVGDTTILGALLGRAPFKPYTSMFRDLAQRL